MKSRPSVWLLLISAALLAISATCWAQTGTTGTAAAPPDTVSTAAPPASAPAEAPPAAPPATSTPATTPPASSTPTSVQPTTPPPPPAQTQAQTSSAPRGNGSPFGKGAMHGSFTAGWGRSFGQDYLMVGAGLGRYIRNGMELALSYEAWFGSDPSVSKLTPEIRMVLARAQRLAIPYVGAFYRRTFIGSDIDDLNSVGARAGIYKGGGRSYVGFGGVWEKYLDCDEKTYEDCTTFYPEGSVGVSF